MEAVVAVERVAAAVEDTAEFLAAVVVEVITITGQAFCHDQFPVAGKRDQDFPALLT